MVSAKSNCPQNGTDMTHPSRRVSEIASMATKLANNLEMHLVPLRFQSLGTKWITACFSICKEVKWLGTNNPEKNVLLDRHLLIKRPTCGFFVECNHLIVVHLFPQIALIIIIWPYIVYTKLIGFWQRVSMDNSIINNKIVDTNWTSYEL